MFVLKFAKLSHDMFLVVSFINVFFIDALQDFSNPEAPCNPGSCAAGTDPRADSNLKPQDRNEPQGEAIFGRDFGDLFSQDDFAKMTEELSKALQDLPVSGIFLHEKESDPDGSVPTGSLFFIKRSSL